MCMVKLRDQLVLKNYTVIAIFGTALLMRSVILSYSYWGLTNQGTILNDSDDYKFLFTINL